MKSVRSYLISRLLGGAAVVLAAAGVAVYVVVTRSVEEQFDRNLTDRVQGFASILFQVADHVEFEFSDELMPQYDDSELAAYFQLWFEDGEILERSNSLGEEDLVVPEKPTETPVHWSAPLPDGRQGRFVSQVIEVHHVYPEEGPDRPQAREVLVVVARGREELIAAERTVLLYCVAGSLLLIFLIAFLSYMAVLRGLEPTSRLAAALDAVRVDFLPRHLDVGDLPSELEPVVETTDALIQRVDTAFKRERRTTADIAHELRSPISELLTVAEVALRNGHDADETRQALGTIRDVAWRMGSSVSTLLKLARLEMGAETFDREAVEVGELLRETLRSFSAVERERELRIENRVELEDLVEGDREVLRIVVSNLLSNALHYSPHGGRVECRVDRTEDGWRIVVENDAGDLRAEDLPALSEPFWRKDRARADRDRSGLGLALSRALAEKAGLELSFAIEDGTFVAILAGREPSEALRMPPEPMG